MNGLVGNGAEQGAEGSVCGTHIIDKRRVGVSLLQSDQSSGDLGRMVRRSQLPVVRVPLVEVGL